MAESVRRQDSRPEPKGYRRLVVWQVADEMASAVFTSCQQRTIPAWLSSQICRSALSVPTNIVEGYTRGSIKDYLHFLDVARASLAESEYQLYFLHKHDLIDEATRASIASLQTQTHNLLIALMKALRKKMADGSWDRISEPRAEYSSDSAAQNLPPSPFLLPGEKGG
jgi:four helix bundle protein